MLRRMSSSLESNVPTQVSKVLKVNILNHQQHQQYQKKLK